MHWTWSAAWRLSEDLRWETATNAGVKAFDQGRYAEAAQQFKTALTLAEDCMPGPHDEPLHGRPQAALPARPQAA